MIDEEAVRRKIKGLEDRINYLKTGYETFADEIRTLKTSMDEMDKILKKICKVLGV